MSSTNRGGQRSPHDYYRTDPADILHFLRAWMADDKTVRDGLARGPILDPCAGGTTQPVQWNLSGQGDLIPVPPASMSYPEALRAQLGVQQEVDTMDIREDSPATWHGDFLVERLRHQSYSAVISNPPFSLAMEFIARALTAVRPGGYVVMLLRLNFFESTKRLPFFTRNAPVRAYVHSSRLSFLPSGKSDSVAYMHAVWRAGIESNATVLRVI